MVSGMAPEARLSKGQLLDFCLSFLVCKPGDDNRTMVECC